MAQYEVSWSEGPWATWKPFQIFFEFLTQTERIQAFRTLWTNCWTIEATWYWSLSCLHVICITRFWKFFCDFSRMISQWLTCSGLRLFSSLEVWCQNLLQGNNFLLKMIQNQMMTFIKSVLLIKKFVNKLPWIVLEQKQNFYFLVISLGMSMKKSFEKNIWSSIKLLLNTFWRIYHMITG